MTDSTEVGTIPEPPSTSVPPAPPLPADALDLSPIRPKRPWLTWAMVAMAVALAAGVWAANEINVGYYEFRPGSARPLGDLVTIDDDVRSFPPESDIAFTTVSLRRSTVWSYILAGFDDDVEVVEERLVLGDRTPSENQTFNQQLMDTSKQDAIRVALLELGLDVPITVDGVIVTQIEPGSAAVGVVEPGDAIVAIEGQPIDEQADIGRIMGGRQPGERVTFSVEPPTRDEIEELTVELGPAPDDPDRGIIGVALSPRNPVYEFPFDIDIDTGAVGGPSAGLAFSLSVLDVLTPGELTGGLQVAVTGTIDGAGNVGQVGGVRQKTAAAIDDGYDVFLVPPAEFDEATERAGDDLQVVAVATLREALDALEALGGSGLDVTGAG